MRESLFIGHATPQDNEFTAWLNSRLQLLGYKTWCDLRGLKGGESDFWNTIQDEIQNNSLKYLLVFSKTTFQKEGVKDEFEYARSIANEFKIDDFIIPLRIEDVPFNARIGLNRFNQINFVDSWVNGLKQLVEKLETDSIPKFANIEYKDLIHNYNKILEINTNSFKNKNELHYSTFWEIKNTPEYVFVYTFYNEQQAKHIEKINNILPLIRHGNNIVCFEERIEFNSPNGKEEIEPTSLQRINVISIIENNYKSEMYPSCSDCVYLLKRLINRTLHLYLKDRGLFWYELSNKSNCYYYPNDLINKNKTTFEYHNRKKTKNVVGKYFSSYWHFAISYKTRIHPFLCYNLKTHIVFSDNGQTIWVNKEKLHKARRKKGKTMFNEEWRDLLFAFLSGLKDENNEIVLPFNSIETTKMNILTKIYSSSIGYSEPKSKDRIDLINTYFDEEEYYTEEENE